MCRPGTDVTVDNHIYLPAHARPLHRRRNSDEELGQALNFGVQFIPHCRAMSKSTRIESQIIDNL